MSKATSASVAPHSTHRSTSGRKPSRASTFMKNAGTTSGGSCGAQRAQRAQQHLVQPRVRLTVQCQLVDGLEHRRRTGDAVEVVADRTEVVDRLGLGDDVELATLVQLHRDVARGFEAGAELALGLANALGNRADLAVALGEQHDDAIGLTELVGAQHHAGIAVEVAHGSATGRLRRARGHRSGARAPGTHAPSRTGAHAGSRATARR